MDAKTVARRVRVLSCSGALILGASLLALGCDEPDARADSGKAQPVAAPAAEAAPTTTVASSGVAPAGEDAPVGAAAASYKEESFHLKLTAPAAIAVGKPLEFKVVLEAQSGFKVNDEYPLKFKFADSEGVVPAKPTVTKADAKVEKKVAEMPLIVTIKSAGKHKVAGTFSFSVCTEERCLIEKRELVVEVNAS